MDGLTLQVYNWLKDIDEDEAAMFLNDCYIESVYIDTLFDLHDEENITHMFNVIVFVPPKKYKQLGNYGTVTGIIEEAINDNGKGAGVYVRNIEWRPRIIIDDERRTKQVGNEILEIINEDYVRSKIRLMDISINSNPHLAIGTAKELIETCCKGILKYHSIVVDKNWDVLRLVKETNKIIDLIPFDVENKEKAEFAVSKILSGFSNISHGITELRNQYGSGHGHHPDFKEIDVLYAKLAVAASSELARFYLTIVNIKKKNAS